MPHKTAIPRAILGRSWATHTADGGAVAIDIALDEGHLVERKRPQKLNGTQAQKVF
jgi:hypothetical protein